MRSISSPVHLGAPRSRCRIRPPVRKAVAKPEKSFRRYKVLQKNEYEFYSGDTQQWGAPKVQTVAHSDLDAQLSKLTCLGDLVWLIADHATDMNSRQLHQALTRLAGFVDQGAMLPDDSFKLKLLSTLTTQVAAKASGFTSDMLIETLWALASLGPGTTDSYVELVLKTAAALKHCDFTSVQDNVSLIWAIGQLAPPGHQLSAEADSLIRNVCSTVSKKEQLKRLIAPEDRTDLATGLSKLARLTGSGVTRKVICQVLEQLAGEVQRDLSNRHSSRAMFTPPQLAAFVRSYADVGHYEGIVARMLDAVSNTVVKMMKAKHIHCFSRPEDMVALLRAYADLGHNSVVIAELLTALSEQLKRELAISHEMAWTARVKQQQEQQTQQQRQGWATAFCSMEVMVELAQCYLDLGYRPGSTLLDALWVEIMSHGAPACLPTTGSFLQKMLLFGYHPGTSNLSRLLSALSSQLETEHQQLARRSAQAASAPPTLRTISDLADILVVCGLLNHPPPQSLVALVESHLQELSQSATQPPVSPSSMASDSANRMSARASTSADVPETSAAAVSPPTAPTAVDFAGGNIVPELAGTDSKPSRTAILKALQGLGYAKMLRARYLKAGLAYLAVASTEVWSEQHIIAAAQACALAVPGDESEASQRYYELLGLLGEPAAVAAKFVPGIPEPKAKMLWERHLKDVLVATTPPSYLSEVKQSLEESGIPYSVGIRCRGVTLPVAVCSGEDGHQQAVMVWDSKCYSVNEPRMLLGPAVVLQRLLER